jgi:hypothetical protein
MRVVILFRHVVVGSGALSKLVFWVGDLHQCEDEATRDMYLETCNPRMDRRYFQKSPKCLMILVAKPLSLARARGGDAWTVLCTSVSKTTLFPCSCVAQVALSAAITSGRGFTSRSHVLSRLQQRESVSYVRPQQKKRSQVFKNHSIENRFLAKTSSSVDKTFPWIQSFVLTCCHR